jgi:hypothetical protein
MPEEGSRAKLEKLYKKGRQSTEQNWIYGPVV